FANDYTLVFDGENDINGLTRQTTIDVNSLEFVPEFSFSEAGMDFSIKKISETGNGFALVNAGGTNAGILVYSAFQAATSITPVVSLTVPNGKITAAKVYMSGSALNALSLIFNEKEIDSESEGSLYYWAWSDSEGVETLNFQWDNKFYNRFIHSIELTYTEDLGGKQECGLSFSATEAEAFLGEEFAAPTLSNPNNLPVSWSSSDEQVATIDTDGNVTLAGAGKTTIIAATDGNDEYAAGNTRYLLTVIPSATSIAEMAEFAPEVYDRVKVAFPATVTFANGNFAFVIDAEGNAGCFEDIRNQGSTQAAKTLYNVGEVIPAGWIATNATIYSSVIWQGIPGKVTETVDVEYPIVEAVTKADVDKVVILSKVTFTTHTAAGNTKAYGTTPDGTQYEFQDTYSVKQYPAGTYDVTCVVRYSKIGSTEYFYLAPISYTESSTTGIKDVDSATTDSAHYFNLQGVEVKSPKAGLYIKATPTQTTKILIK
ncbi:MAG: Ig-like domain-containing protein, partial [Muribaculaceae bacterium]|nr:Ig-like domain-containing protein [Muribaculaceae bacterium]